MTPHYKYEVFDGAISRCIIDFLIQRWWNNIASFFDAPMLAGTFIL